MISGNNNRSPQYGTMGPKGDRPSNYPSQHHYQQQQPHLLFMAGGSVRRFPQMSQGFSTMTNGTPLRPTVVQCNMQHNFGSGYGYSSNSAPIFQQHYQYQHPAAVPVHYQPPLQYVHQPYMNTSPPSAATHITPTSGFINGIKNMVKGLIQPLNCDFYSDHHKYYNPKYRKNYMRDIASEKMSYTGHQPESRVKAAVFDCVNLGEKKLGGSTACIPKSNQSTVPPSSPKKTPSEVLTIFTSEDFPELPAPRRNRSTTPAKTEKTPERLTKLEAECAKSIEPLVPTLISSSCSPPKPAAPSKEPSPSQSFDAKPKCMFFEIKCTTIPCGRRPTFGGRLKMVPPPFSFNKSHRTCRTNCQESKPYEDCDTEDDSFVIFRKQQPDECIATPIGGCRPPRQRQISECSDDSFVVFSAEDVELDDNEEDDEDDESDEDDDADDGLDSDETSSEEDVDSDSDDDNDEWIDDDGHDVVDSSFGKNKTDSNKCTGETLFKRSGIEFADSEISQFDSGFDEKKVTFNPKPVVHVMHTWNYAYRAARKGHWENFARDRGRFRVRIERASTLLNPILTPEHRERIYQERFCDKSNEEQQQQHQNQAPATTINSDKRSAHNSIDQSVDSQILPKSAEVTLC